MASDQAPYLPSTIAVTFRGQACGKALWATTPTIWTTTVKLTDTGLGLTTTNPTTLAIRDRALAVYSDAAAAVVTGQKTTPPGNATALQALAKQIAVDFYAWRLTAYDRVYAGVVAPVLDGTVDLITWSMSEPKLDGEGHLIAGGVTTRMRSAPLNSEAIVMGHSDAVHDCDGRVGVYGTAPKLALSGGKLTVQRLRLYIEDGLLKWATDKTDSVVICPTTTPPPPPPPPPGAPTPG